VVVVVAGVTGSTSAATVVVVVVVAGVTGSTSAAVVVVIEVVVFVVVDVAGTASPMVVVVVTIVVVVVVVVAAAGSIHTFQPGRLVPCTSSLTQNIGTFFLRGTLWKLSSSSEASPVKLV